MASGRLSGGAGRASFIDDYWDLLLVLASNSYDSTAWLAKHPKIGLAPNRHY